MSNKTELLQKIKALADRGVEGERESAQAILSRLMEQYGISEAELEEDRRETAWFAYSQEIERRRGCLLEGEEYKTAPFGFNRLAKEVHENAVAHGWWEEERGLPEVLMLCVSELAEALEEYRNGRPTLYYPCNAGGVCCEEDGSAHCGSRPYNPNNPEAPCSAQSKKPEGVAVELADCVIRILDYCGHAGIDLEEAIRIKHEYNKSRPYRHGGKKC